MALVISIIIPLIAVAGAVMNTFMSKYKQIQLEATAKGATLAEEVISSIRSAHAFGNQKRLTDTYEVANEETARVGGISARFHGLGLGVFFFISTLLPLAPTAHRTLTLSASQSTPPTGASLCRDCLLLPLTSILPCPI